jgi:tRNA(Ile)-lysidine synthase
MYHCPVHELAQSVLAYVRKHDLIHPGDRVAVAISGGADSVALLRLMLELRDELGIILSIVHLNHQLRGPDSDADEQFVRELAKAHDLEITCESRDVKSFASERKLSLEAAAREARYEFFGRVLQSAANRLATAHTLDDQAETVLLKLTRGAGTRGLAAVFPQLVVGRGSSIVDSEARNRPAIVRPLLGTRRSQLRNYLDEIGQPWREDATNQDLRHARNRIRHEILPQLERDLNPSVAEALAETAEIARAEEEYWSAEMRRLLPQIVSQRGGSVALEIPALHSLPLALQRRLVRAAAESVGLTLRFSHVEEALSLARQGESAALPNGWTVTRHAGELIFEACSGPTHAYEYPLAVPGKIKIAEAALALEVALIKQESTPACDGLLDSRFAGHALIVRNWRPGERFWPAHTKQPKKIKELLQDRHITGVEKRLWPVIASGDEIVWVRGFGVGRDFQAKSASAILIREIPQDARLT